MTTHQFTTAHAKTVAASVNEIADDMLTTYIARMVRKGQPQNKIDERRAKIIDQRDRTLSAIALVDEKAPQYIESMSALMDADEAEEMAAKLVK